MPFCHTNRCQLLRVLTLHAYDSENRATIAVNGYSNSLRPAGKRFGGWSTLDVVLAEFVNDGVYGLNGGFDRYALLTHPSPFLRPCVYQFVVPVFIGCPNAGTNAISIRSH